jgi:hypothetical protein
MYIDMHFIHIHIFVCDTGYVCQIFERMFEYTMGDKKKGARKEKICFTNSPISLELFIQF